MGAGYGQGSHRRPLRGDQPPTLAPPTPRPPLWPSRPACETQLGTSAGITRHPQLLSRAEAGRCWGDRRAEGHPEVRALSGGLCRTQGEARAGHRGRPGQDTGGEAGLSQGGGSARAGQRLPQERAPSQDRRMRGKVCQVECWAQGDPRGRGTGQQVNEQTWAPSGAAQAAQALGRLPYSHPRSAWPSSPEIQLQLSSQRFRTTVCNRLHHLNQLPPSPTTSSSGTGVTSVSLTRVWRVLGAA